MLTGVRIIDLTQPLGAATPPWPGGRRSRPRSASRSTPAGRVPFAASPSTSTSARHIDAPAHFARDGIRVEAIPVDQLVRPAVVVDVREACAADRDLHVPAATFEAFEAEHGTHPAGHGGAGDDRLGQRFARRSGRYLTDLHFPGLATDAARLLVDREVAGIGIDTLGIDPG